MTVNYIILLINKGRQYLSKFGFIKTAEKVYKVLKQQRKLHKRSKDWLTSEKILQEQRECVFQYAPVISIIVPLFNTPVSYLCEMLESVCAQSYVNWELCLADGSDSTICLEETIRQFEMNYPGKIKYARLKENKGISENTNACIRLAKGDYLALLDHDDILAPDALFEAVKAINDMHADFIYTDETIFVNNLNNILSVHFKPDFAIDNLRANNYICHFTLFKKSLLEKVGIFRKEYDGSQDHDMVLRLTEVAERIVHIPKILYYWRAHKNSVAADINSKSYAAEAGKNAVLDHLKRQGFKAVVESSKAFPTIYRIKYELVEKPLISIIIIGTDELKKIKSCIESIPKMSTYPECEIIIVDNASHNEDLISYYEEIRKQTRIQVIQCKQPFNYSATHNFGAKYANGKFLIFLSSETKVITPNWMEEMLMYAQRQEVGAVGAKLYYPNDTIRHAGIILGLGKDRVTGYAHENSSKSEVGYMGRLFYAQDMSAVSTVCMMVRKSIYDKMGGFDEAFTITNYDSDFCLRLRRAGYVVVFTPYAELYYNSRKQWPFRNKLRKNKKFQTENKLFTERWEKEIREGDPYYNKNLSLDSTDFSIK